MTDRAAVAGLLEATRQIWSEPSASGRRERALMAARQLVDQGGDGQQLVAGGAAVLAAALRMEFCGSALLNEQGQAAFALEAASGEQDGPLARGALRSRSTFQLGEGTALAYVLADPRPLYFTELATEQRFADKLLERYAVRAGLVFPVTGEGLQAAVGVFSTRLPQLQVDDLRLVQTVARQLGNPADSRSVEVLPPESAEAEGGGDQAARELQPPPRRAPRREFQTLQCIAPMRGETLPAPESFREVRCHDISSRGFSYVVAQEPEYERLVVVFGAGRSRILLLAQVLHVNAFREQGRIEYLVGCKYTGRANF